MVIFHSEKVYQQVFGKSRGNQRKPGDPNMIKIPILFVSVLKSALHVKKKQPILFIRIFLAGALANTKTMTSEEVEVTFAAHLLFGALALPAPPC